MEFNKITTLVSILTSAAVSLIVSALVNRWTAKQSNRHYEQDHENELVHGILKDAPDMRKETFEQFQAQNQGHTLLFGEMDVLENEKIQGETSKRTKKFFFSTGSISDKVLGTSRRWVAITVANKNSYGFQITSISTADDTRVPISDSGFNLIGSGTTATYLFPYRDCPKTIFGKFHNLSLAYHIPRDTGFSTPELDDNND